MPLSENFCLGAANTGTCDVWNYMVPRNFVMCSISIVRFNCFETSIKLKFCSEVPGCSAAERPSWSELFLCRLFSCIPYPSHSGFWTPCSWTAAGLQPWTLSVPPEIPLTVTFELVRSFLRARAEPQLVIFLSMLGDKNPEITKILSQWTMNNIFPYHFYLSERMWLGEV